VTKADLGRMAVALVQQGEGAGGGRGRWIGYIRGLGQMQDKNRKLVFKFLADEMSVFK
jgi:hypothetical protein